MLDVNKNHYFLVTIAVFILIISGCSMREEKDQSIVTPPIAEKRPHSMVTHDEERIDPYYWLRDDTRSDPDVLTYLEAENTYTQSMMAHT
ncbi:MAG: hypothetical protein ACI9P7_002033, partial [Candidatus Azotimanducaceae bacterium]